MQGGAPVWRVTYSRRQWPNVSCVRAVKWAAWHLQLQPLGLNKGRSLAAFPTQLSPFYHGFHSCFVLSVSLSLYRVHTMRRHLGRVHSSVFSIFSPCFWLPAIFFALLHRPVPVRREPTIRRLQPIRKFYPLLRQFPWSMEVLLEPGSTRRFAFSFPIPLDWFFKIASFFRWFSSERCFVYRFSNWRGIFDRFGSLRWTQPRRSYTPMIELPFCKDFSICNFAHLDFNV